MDFTLKTTQKPVKDYYAALDSYIKLGFKHEGEVKNAFAGLLRSVSKK